MKSSIATVCVAGSITEKLSAIARAGFDGIELFENDFVSSPHSAEDIRSRTADLGLTIDLYQPFRDFESVTSEQLDRNLERARRKFDLMYRLGTTTILVCSNVATAVDGERATAADQLGRLAELAGEHGVRVAYEALAWGRYVSTYDEAWRVVSEVDHAALGVCLDSFHILSRGTSLETIDEIPGEKIFFCQLADAPRMHMDVLSWSRHHRLFPGEGDWDLVDFVARLLRAGYSGPLSLEVFNDVFRQSDPMHTARDARRSLLFLEDEVLQRFGAVAELSPLPPAQALRGVAFIECAPGPDDALENALSGLGFTRYGRHARKSAELWGQGEIRIVVNPDHEPDRAALVGVGLDVDDVGAAGERTAALHSRRLPRDRSGEEATLEATVAPDGTEFYFAERNPTGRPWEREFPPPTDARDSLGLTVIDHVALIQPGDRFDEAALFARSVLGLEPQDPFELASETGLVRSRAMVSSDRAVRLALNVSPASPVREGRYLNHVAFAAHDIRRAAATARDAGVRMLAVPANYYDDLEARFGLDRAFVGDLAASDLLYDRDERGEFLHAYTVPVGDLLFEILERRGDYRGYGVANATVRLAAVRNLVMDRARG